jgi:TIR domain
VSAPKLFVSYSWSNPDHAAWVLDLAQQLVSQGIDVKLDKWDLLPGHDANVFMESMVGDPSVTKVVMICDQSYIIKSNSRAGGAGIEAQIISPELYSKSAQDKFVAVIRERDASGNIVVPTYYKGRIFIDLSEPSTYAEGFEQLIRWAWDEPLHVRPAIGQKSNYLVANSSCN